MEKTADIEDSVKVLEELDMFSRSMPSNYLFNGSDKFEVLLGASRSG